MNPENPERDLKAETEHISAVIENHRDELLRMPHVVGVAVGFQKQAGLSTQNLALVVLVDAKVDPAGLEPGESIPPKIDGVIVDVQEIGPVVAQE
jgi:hypothetical protein